MSDHVLLSTRWNKSGTIQFDSSGVIDKENGIIPNVILCQVGPAKGHGVHLEQSFIDDCLASAQLNHSGIGMKARLGHPSMSNDTVGKEMGRFKNFKVEGEQLKADLHLFESANLSPTNPGMRDWMLSMAEEDPSAIMCSIVFTRDHFYQYDQDGKKIKVLQHNDKGDWVEANSEMKIFVALQELHFCDIVDEGAATESLLSSELNRDKFAVIATEFLNEQPLVDAFIKQNPDKLLKFLTDRYGIKTDSAHSFGSQIKQFFASLIPDFKTPFNKPMKLSKVATVLANPEATEDERNEALAELQQFQGENEVFSQEEVQSQIDSATADLNTQLQKANTDKTALQSTVDELNQKVSELETEGPKPPVAKSDESLTDGNVSKVEFETEIDKEMKAFYDQNQ